MARGIGMEKGNIFTTEFIDDDATLAWIDKHSHSTNEHILLLSRLPHRRLLEHIDINAVEAYWLTERVTDGSLRPNLDEILDLIKRHLNHHMGLIMLEGLEWLVTQHGEDNVLSFIRTLRESVHRTQWTIVVPLRPLAFDSLWLARLRREAPVIYLDEQSAPEVVEKTEDTETLDAPIDTPAEFDILDDGSPKLIHLTRLPKIGFSKSILRKRILQWRRMGLDVSEVEPAMSLQDGEDYQLYAVVEEKVRMAVDIDSYLEMNKDDFSASELAGARFRIRQLTGLEEMTSKYFSF
ncbi:MAG: hypothetical protein CL988_05180 [Euryarchaeota archaeon]|nr:hypothetical protein [Euryarchaeota archaeon]